MESFGGDGEVVEQENVSICETLWTLLGADLLMA